MQIFLNKEVRKEAFFISAIVTIYYPNKEMFNNELRGNKFKNIYLKMI